MDRWVSDELSEAMVPLTAKQASAIQRIVQAELEGASLTSLLEGPNKICAWLTYHGTGKRSGWKTRPHFKKALELARRDFRAHALAHGTQEAIEILAATAPESARALRQRVEGDSLAISTLIDILMSDKAPERARAARLLGATGLPRAAPALRTALIIEENDGVREALLLALGKIAAGEARDLDAPTEVLDRADLATASKGTRAITGGDGGPVGVKITEVVVEMPELDDGQEPVED